MADTKKISELNSTSNLANEDEFVVVDKNGTGADSSSSGKTSKIRFDALKNQIGSQGQKGQKGEANKGQKGEANKGQKGEANKGQKGEPLEFTDLSSAQRTSLKGQKGEASKGQKGEPLEFNDLSSAQRTSLKGQKGEKGYEGKKLTFSDLSTSERTSLKGQKGEANKGQKGEASKGQKGEVGVKLTFNDLSTSERTSLKGQKGEANKGQKGEANKGQKGEANKGQKGEVDEYASAKSLFHRNANALVGKSTDVLYKVAGGVAWDAGVWSKKSHKNGASISFKVGSRMYAKKPVFIIGFNSSTNKYDPAPGSYFDYGIYYHGVNNKLYFRKGTSNGSGRDLPANGGTFTMTYDAKNVRIYINNDLVFTFNFDLDKTFSMKASLYSPVNPKYESRGNSYLDPIVYNLQFSPYGASGDDGQKGQKGEANKGQKGNTGSATVTTNASAITSGVLNPARIPLLEPTKISGTGNLEYTGKVELYESGKQTTEIHNGGSISMGSDLNSNSFFGVFLSGKPNQSNMLMNPLAIGGSNGLIPSGNKLWVNGTASIHNLYTNSHQSSYLFMTKQNTATNSKEGGEIAFQRGDSVGDKNTMIMDVYGRGNEARFRFFDNNPHTKVFAEISKNGLMVNGDLTATGRTATTGMQGVRSTMNCANQLQFQGSAATAITIDGMLIVAEMPVHNGHQVHVRAYDITNGRYLKTIEPSVSRGTSSAKYAGGFGLGGYYYGSIIQAETHNHNGTEKDRSKSTILYWCSHNQSIRIEYNKSTKLFTSKRMGTSQNNWTHYWQPIATYNSGKTYDNMLVNHGDPHGSVNPDNHVQIYNQSWTGSGWTQSWRYLGLSNINGYKQLVNNDNDSYTFMYIAGINPYSGRVYIHGTDEGNMLHTFQIKSSLKKSNKSWAETMWDNMNTSGSPNYGNKGGLEWVKSHKLPYVNEYVNDDASSFSKRITFDPATKLPVCITIAAYGNDHGAGGTKVLAWNPDWT